MSENKTEERRFVMGTLVGMLVAISMALSSGYLYAQEVGKTKELSPGRVQKIIAEFASNVPGYDRVRIVEETAQPGATWREGNPMEAAMYCTILGGDRTSVSPDGKKSTRKAGDSWVCELGQKRNPKVEHKITSKEPWVMRMHWLLKAGDK
jgi:hypothetical protein